MQGFGDILGPGGRSVGGGRLVGLKARGLSLPHPIFNFMLSCFNDSGAFSFGGEPRLS